jgi:hypothetical protein
MRVFMTKPFARLARAESVTDAQLCDAVRRAEKGLVDADLGGGVIKQRVARPGRGKSGGLRSIVLFRSGDKAFFVYGFAKSDRGNIRRDELRAFRKLSDVMLALDERGLASAMRNGTITEIACDE